MSEIKTADLLDTAKKIIDLFLDAKNGKIKDAEKMAEILAIELKNYSERSVNGYKANQFKHSVGDDDYINGFNAGLDAFKSYLKEQSVIPNDGTKVKLESVYRSLLQQIEIIRTNSKLSTPNDSDAVEFAEFIKDYYKTTLKAKFFFQRYTNKPFTAKQLYELFLKTKGK